MADDELFTVTEVAARLKVRPATVRRWVREGRLRGSMIGGTKTGYRIPASEVRRLVTSGLRADDPPLG